MDKRRRIETKTGVLDSMGAVNYEYKKAINKTYFYGSDIDFSISLFDTNNSSLVLLITGKEFTRIRTALITYSFLRFQNKKYHKALILGNGYQAFGQAKALFSLGIKKIDVWGRNEEKAKSFSHLIMDSLGIESSYALRDSFKEYELIITATSATEPIIFKKDVNVNATIIAIGSYKKEMAELDTSLICNSSLLISDFKEQAVDESGEIYNAINQGCIKLENIFNLSYIFMKGIPHNENKNGPVILKSVGMAAEDLALAIAIYNKITKGC